MPGIFKIKNLQDAEFTLTHPDGVGAVSIDSNNIAKSDVVNAALALKANTADLKEIGVGQTWQDVTASRALGTTYTNTTGKPIEIIISIGITNTINDKFFNVNGVLIGTMPGSTTNGNDIWTFIVPNGATYSLGGSNYSIVRWFELR